MSETSINYPNSTVHLLALRMLQTEDCGAKDCQSALLSACAYHTNVEARTVQNFLNNTHVRNV